MRSTDQAEVVESRRSAIAPEDEVMPIAPGRRPVAAGEHTVVIARDQRATGRRRDTPSRVRDFLLELAKARDARDRRVAGDPAQRLGGNGAAPLELGRRRALDTGQSVEARLDDHLRPRTSAIRVGAAVSRLAALDQGID